MKKFLFVGLAISALAVYQCDRRPPTGTLEDHSPATKIFLITKTEKPIVAGVDSIGLTVELTDSNGNKLESVNEVTLSVSEGVYSEISTADNETAGVRQFLYYSPGTIDTVKTVVIKAQYVNRGIQRNLGSEADTISDSILVTVLPQKDALGYLLPRRVSVNVRTDTVYKYGAGWSMVVDALVSDSLGNPVKGKTPVIFGFGESSADTNFITLGNLAYTGMKVCIGSNCDSIVGEALSVLTYNSRAIADTVVVRAAVGEGKSITDEITIRLPLPVQDLNIQAHYENGGPLRIASDSVDTARIRVTLHDAYDVPVPGMKISVHPRTVGRTLPNCAVYDSFQRVVGSTPCDCDTVYLPECLVLDSSGTKIIDFSCDAPFVVNACDTLRDRFSGITDANGEFTVWIQIGRHDLLDGTTPNQSVEVELVERSTGTLNREFSFDVLFQ